MCRGLWRDVKDISRERQKPDSPYELKRYREMYLFRSKRIIKTTYSDVINRVFLE